MIEIPRPHRNFIIGETELREMIRRSLRAGYYIRADDLHGFEQELYEPIPEDTETEIEAAVEQAFDYFTTPEMNHLTPLDPNANK